MQVKCIRLVSLFGLVILLSAACNFRVEPPGSPPGAVFAEPSMPTDAVVQTAPSQTAASSTTAVLPTPSNTVSRSAATTPSVTSSPEGSRVATGTATSELPATEVITPTVIPPTQTSGAMRNDEFLSPLENATLKLTDNFNGSGTFITASIEDSYSIDYTEETFRFEILDPEINAWVIRSQSVSNVRQEIDIVAGDGAVDGYFGLICRWESSSAYYRFTISLDGSVKITKVFLNITTDLAQAQDKSYAPADSNPVRLRADCSDRNLFLYLDGELILTAEDYEIRIGKVGLVAGTVGSGPLTIDVDNYELYYR